MEMADENVQKRQHYRIVYPNPARPLLVNGKDIYNVIDLSEGGVCFEVPKKAKFEKKVGDEFRGSITFHDKITVIIQAKVLRSNGDRVVLVLAPPLPLTRIMLEQRYLIRQFGYKPQLS